VALDHHYAVLFSSSERERPMSPSLIKKFQKRLLAWYHDNKRELPWRETQNPYHIWVSEVMLQQTQVATVTGYFTRFIERFPDIETLARADLTDVLKLWEGLGYYSRARHLHRAANEVALHHGKEVPDTPETFRRLPGVGDYINAAVQSIAFGHPLAVVDGNVKRVLSRLFLIDTPVNQAGAHGLFYPYAEKMLDISDPSSFNQAMMELGAMICKPGASPCCGQCPVSDLCRASITGKTGAFPKRAASKKIPIKEMAAGLVFHEGRFLVIQRPSEGFLGGMWELPGGVLEGNVSIETALGERIVAQTGVQVTPIQHIADVKHAYTHFKLKLSLYACCLPSGSPSLEKRSGDLRWIGVDEIESYPFHKAMHKCFAAAIAWMRNSNSTFL
jgi:A/G-specific adenine glycosylase